MEDKLCRDDFAKYEGTKFEVFLNSEEPTEFELAEVSEVRNLDRIESFSLVFHAPVTALLVTGIVKMEHVKLGSLDINISPFTQDENITKYESVFNYLIGEADAPPPTGLESN